MVLGLAALLPLAAAACGGGTPDAAPPSHHHHAKFGTATTTTTSTSTAASASKPTSTTPTAARSIVAPLTTTTTTKSVTTPAFRGVFEFAGNNSSADATNPDLAGVVLVYYWSQIEPEKGSFDWTLIDDDMAPWIAAGKKVIIRISTSGVAAWDPPYSASGTPQWVFDDGTRAISDNGETIPVYWDQPYLTDYDSFVHSFAQQFDGNPNIAFIEAGIGMGGETLPETNASAAGIAAWQSDGYTDSLWLSTVEAIASFFEGSFHKTAIFPLVDMTFFDGSISEYNALLSWFKAIPNWGLQYDGLTSTQQLGPAWSGRPIALEQRNPTRTSGDCLCADISNGLDNLHGNYLLIYQSDIDDPANEGYLNQAAAEAR
jgi:hypothetical protein